MEKEKNLFVIRRNGGSANDSDHYAAHGEMGGMKDAIGYSNMEDARIFLSREQAQAYIDRVLPEWARKEHHPAQIRHRDVALVMPRLSGLLYLRENGVEIPPELLEPNKNKLLIWRR